MKEDTRTFKIENMFPECFDEHLSPSKQLAFWQALFHEIGYHLYIESVPSGCTEDGEMTEQTIRYHAEKYDNPEEHYVIAYARKVKREYDF